MRKKESLRSIIDLFVNNNKYLPVLLGVNGDPGFRSKMLNRLRPKILERMPEISKKDRCRLEYLLEYQSSAVLNMIVLWNKKEKDISMEEFLELVLSVTQNGVQKEMISFMTQHKKEEGNAK